MHARTSSILVAALWAFGCSSASKPDTSAGGAGATDTGTPEDTYEEGCIAINGSGSYRWLNDAISVANPGDEISVCSGTLVESVVVNKEVTILGPEVGEDPFVLAAPDFEPAMVVTADSAVIARVTVHAEQDAVLTEGTTGVRLASVVFDEVNGLGLAAEDTTDLIVTHCTFSGGEPGGMRLKSGSANVTGSTFDATRSSGLWVTGGGVVELDTSTFTGVRAEADDEVSGSGVRVTEQGTVIATDNLFVDNTTFGYLVDGGVLTTTGDTIQGGQSGIWMPNGTLDASGVSIVDAEVTGILAVGGDSPISVSGTTVSANPDASISLSPDEWNDDKQNQGTGMYLVSNTAVTLTGATIEGYNNAGVIIATTTGADPTVAIDGVTITDVGRIGLYLASITAVVSDTSVTGIRELDDEDEDQCLTVGNVGAATLSHSDVTWTGGTISDNEGYGLASLAGTLTVSDVDVANNRCAGVMNYQGIVRVTDSRFSQPGILDAVGSIVSYQGEETVVSGSAFEASQRVVEDYTYEYTDGGTSYEYVYYDTRGTDIQLLGGAGHAIRDNTFAQGAQGVFVYQTGAEVSGNTWSDYDQYGVYVREGTAIYSGNSYARSAGFGVACVDGDITVADSSFVDGVENSRSFELYADGELVSTYPATAAYPALYSEGCALTGTDLLMTNLARNAITAVSGTVDLERVDIDVSGASVAAYSAALRFEAAEGDLDVTLIDVSVADNRSLSAVAFSVDASVEPPPEGTLSADELTVNGSTGNGIDLEGVTAELRDLTISGTDGPSVHIVEGTVTIDDGILSSSGSYGISATNADVTVQAVTVQHSISSGVIASGGELTLSGNTIADNGGSGIVATSVDLSAEENTISDNEGYGMACTDVTIVSCTNEVHDNMLGDHSGCDACSFTTDDD